MAWGSKTQVMTSQSVVGTELFSSAVTLTPKNTVHFEVEANSNGTTDNLTIAVYGTLDASTENYDDVPIMTFDLDCTSGDDEKVSFVIEGLYKFRVGAVRNGSTDTLLTDMYYREDGVDL